MHIVIDFDYTLFDTKKMRHKIADALSIEREYFFSMEKKITDEKRLYTAKEHCDLLGISQDAFFAALGEIAPECVYSDVIDFFDTMPQAKMTLLTFGDTQWQQEKVQAAQIEHFFDECILTDRPKEEVVCQWENEHDILFVNDRAAEIDRMYEVFQGAVYLLLQRKESPYRQEKSRFAHARIQSFLEITPYI